MALIKTSNVCRRLSHHYLATELAHKRTPIPFNSSTTALRDYVYSTDLVALLNAILHKTDKKYRGEIFDACSGHGHSAPENFETMKEHAGSGIGPRFGESEQFWSRYPELVKEPYVLDPKGVKKEVYKVSGGDPTKTERQFGWRATTGLKKGLGGIWKYTLANV